jgi:hypothetical protein
VLGFLKGFCIYLFYHLSVVKVAGSVAFDGNRKIISEKIKKKNKALNKSACIRFWYFIRNNIKVISKALL